MCSLSINFYVRLLMRVYIIEVLKVELHMAAFEVVGAARCAA